MSMSAVRNAEMIIDTKLPSLETIYIDRIKSLWPTLLENRSGQNS